MRARLLAIAVAAAVGVSALGAAPAGAATVSCGDTLTQTTRLTADIDCSGLPTAGIGLRVTADNIVLDLNGHTIRGPNDPGTFPVTGVLATGARDIVRGGTITGFSTDVVARSTVLTGLTLTDAAVGAELGDNAELSRSAISRVDVGVESESSGERIVRDTIHAAGRSGDPACAGIVGGGTCVGISLFDGGHALIRNTTITSLGIGISLQGRAIGGDTLERNAVTCEGSGAARETGACIILGDGAGNNVLARNTVHAFIRDEIAINGQDGDTLTGNIAGGSIDGSGIVLSDVDDSTVKANATNDNKDTFDNGAYGLLVIGNGNLIERNTASRNDLDGILSIGTNTLTANTARDNGGLGIQAIGGAIDGGRNRASGNAEPQCIGVTCTP